MVTITLPKDGIRIEPGSGLGFSGTATDAEDGDLSDQLRWQSSLDGDLGTGPFLSGIVLSEGTHTLTATVQDTQGLFRQATITVEVQRKGNTIVMVPILKLLLLDNDNIPHNDNEETTDDNPQ